MKTAHETEPETGTPTYRCESCGKEFDTPDALHDHVYSIGLVY